MYGLKKRARTGPRMLVEEGFSQLLHQWTSEVRMSPQLGKTVFKAMRLNNYLMQFFYFFTTKDVHLDNDHTIN